MEYSGQERRKTGKWSETTERHVGCKSLWYYVDSSITSKELKKQEPVSTDQWMDRWMDVFRGKSYLISNVKDWIHKVHTRTHSHMKEWKSFVRTIRLTPFFQVVFVLAMMMIWWSSSGCTISNEILKHATFVICIRFHQFLHQSDRAGLLYKLNKLSNKYLKFNLNDSRDHWSSPPWIDTLQRTDFSGRAIILIFFQIVGIGYMWGACSDSSTYYLVYRYSTQDTPHREARRTCEPILFTG